MKRIESLYDVKWNPRILIEASAGTGKTYTLTALYIRLLVEKKLDVDRILVMTFTKKATAELKERIFRRLKECLNRLETGKESDDSFVNEFADQVSNSDEAIQRLKTAIQNFDDSQVYTIHGFCQKILKEEALLAGTPFDFEVAQQDELLTQASEDFWRNFMAQYSQSEAGRYYISKLLGIANSPSELRDKLQLVFSKPYAELEGEGIGNPVQYLEKVLNIRRDLVELWGRNQEELLEILNQCYVKRFQQHLQSRLRKLNAFIDDDSFELDAPESLKYFTSDYLYDPKNLPKSGNPKPTIQHRFFDLCSELESLIAEMDKVKTTLIQEAIEGITIIREKLSINSSTVTYDDLLTRVERALTHSEDAEELAGILNQKYPAALVDEFQDTDPVQYSILNSIYPSQNTNSSLLMIGDPKQAIYAFRGADVHTYLKAKKEPSVQQYTLHKNFRSTPSFNKAVNTLFGFSGQPFIEEGIQYFDVEAGNEESEDDFLVDGIPASGIRILAKPGIDTSKKDANEFAFYQTVSEITKLLRGSEEGKVRMKGRKLEAGDIAILVSSHKSGEEIKQRLKAVGIDSVTYSREKVFESAEARRLESVMSAILEPFNRIAVNNALVSGFWGQNLNEIHELSIEGNQRQELIEELQDLNETWSYDGFYTMFRKLLFDDGRITKLAQFSNSERIVTNLYQLADICSKAEKEGKLNPYSLHFWFVDEMADPDKDDEKTLLLESDQNLVKISTIHNSKGLEFPVVFCPTLWDMKSNNKKPLLIEYHEDGEPIIRFDQESGERSEWAEGQNNIEDTAEEIRKYYVAVTRAKYLCVIPWANHEASLKSGVACSLVDRSAAQEIAKKGLKLKSGTDYTDDKILNIFKDLENKSDGAIELNIPENIDEMEKSGPEKWIQKSELQLKNYKGRTELAVQRRIESFSSLTSHSALPGEPDYDQVVESYLSLIHQQREEVRDLSIFTFPRGATAGTAIHKLFEDDHFLFETARSDDHSGLIEKVLEQYQMDGKWIPVIQRMMRGVVTSDIPGLDLSKVKNSEQLREMEFHFTARQPSLENILRIIRSGNQSLILQGQLESFMTGFIDLVVRQNGKYFIVDYKSNHLGDSIEDYSQPRLKEEIIHASYDVQYHLYTVALCKYLKSRLPGFNYDSDFGGVAYLFVRGMQKNEGSGVWFHKPDEAVIRRLANELEVQL
ncbi:exodeoxyribonuclease V subunit beta [Rhodohalobacter sp. 614A]|uniref:exodeoxyribonuclease V subunit beta n=1 Tax=Rhodohalobacter sp. 614A TaxID=2908649 RepID=UPI001F3EA1F0|nr:exodeoxyribonuclease V subunit beta [Rhodohalobacter sp. 614A]